MISNVILDQRYAVFRQVCDRRYNWLRPYLYATTRDSRTAIELCRLAIRENPLSRVWRQAILDGQMPDPDDVAPRTRDCWRHAASHDPTRYHYRQEIPDYGEDESFHRDD